MKEECTLDILPDSRAKTARGIVSVRGTNYIPIFCANCGKQGGGVSQEHVTFCFWLCDHCYEKWGAVAGVSFVPDEVFWEKVKAAQLEEYGHILDADEIFLEAAKPESIIAKLVRDAPKGK
jgi:hypothetical protein